jgi:hypothetical protein
MLKLRSIGLSDYAVLESGQRIGRIRLATEHMPCVWLWSITIHLPGGLPLGSSKDRDTAKAEFKAAWEALKARTPPEQLAAAYKAMNTRDDGKGGELPHHRITGRVGLTDAITGSQDNRTQQDRQKGQDHVILRSRRPAMTGSRK